ncbi:hypothetical protein, partial [Caldivirga sp.]|uniref:hypothetical protein n=1 Tax=Caldivirga sp. TaxID=2080243 RepID=UPI003D0D209B
MTHYMAKAFIVKHLIGNIARELRGRGLSEEDALKKAVDCVETEYSQGSVRFDVYVKSDCGSAFSGLAVEVETLYGTGTIVHKLLDTIESRVNVNVVNRLWIVVPNPQAVIYLPLLLKLRNHARASHRAIEFYTLDLYNGELVRLIDMAVIILGSLGAYKA